jgi:DNA-binding NarL/FixJ family response regulator
MTRPTPSRADAPIGAIRIVIADDHTIVRDGLRALVEAQPGLLVVGEAADGHEAWLRACELQPDVLLLDLSMPPVGGADAAERIARDCPRVRLLALTMHEERGYVTRLLRAGAAGYLLKRTAAAELVRAIRTVAAGGTYVDPSLAGALLTEPSPRAGRNARSDAAPVADLTRREREVLRLVARGHSNKEIAAALEISVKTVETHKANAMAKLGLGSRAALVRFAMDEAWFADGHS